VRSTLRNSVLTAVVLAVVAAVTVATPTSGASRGDSQSDSSAIAATVSEYHHALESGDSAKALSLLANDAVILESGGMESRAEYRSHHLSGDIEFARAVKSVRSPLAVTVNGSTAWTYGTSTTQGSFNGRAINSVGAESMILSKDSKGWKIRQIHWSSRTRRPAATTSNP
jgi:ketosteroid isomerase-like protein